MGSKLARGYHFILGLVLILGIASLGFLLLASNVHAQGIANIEISGSQSSWFAAFPDVSLPVTVIGTNGLPIAGLSQDAFSVSEDGQPVQLKDVGSIRDSTSPIYLVLAIDTSGSMSADDALEKAKTAASMLVNDLGPNDKVAIVAFGNHVELSPPGSKQPIDVTKERYFTNNKDDVLGLINSLSTVPGKVTTPLWDAALKSVLLAQQAPVRRRAVILLTDGNEGDAQGKPVSQYRSEDAFLEAIRSRVPVYTIGLGPKANAQYLRSLSERTGGEYKYTADPQNLKDIYLGWFHRFKTAYKLRYRSDLHADGAAHEIAVSVSTQGGSAATIAHVTISKPIVVLKVNYLKPATVKGEKPVAVPLENGQVFENDITVEPVIDAEQDGVGKVEYFLNGQLNQTALEPPFHAFISDVYTQTTSLQLMVRAYDKKDPSLYDDETVSFVMEPKKTSSVATWFEILLAVLFLIGIIVITYAVRRTRIVKGSHESVVLVGDRTRQDATVDENMLGVPPVSSGEPFGPEPTSGAVPEPPGPEPAVRPGAVDATVVGEPSLSSQVERASAWFVGVSESIKGRSFSVEADNIVVGRHPQAGITIDDPTVSREHARLRWQGGVYRLYDLGSTNGTFVNGARVQESLVHDNDRVRFGDAELLFRVA